MNSEGMKFHILLADKDRTILNLLKQILCGKGCEVFNATSAKAALKIAKKMNIHLAVIDMKLSDARGTELILMLKAIHPNIRIIFTTPDHSIETETEARTMGIILYMPKPLDLELLEKAITKGLKGIQLNERGQSS
jgi:DNA-binding NtrC family response regulator